MPEEALKGLKILDLTQGIAGPTCTRILAGFGADIIKIEKPHEGDPARHMGPFLNDEPGLERSGLFLYLNNNKKSITLNLKSKTGRELFKDMLRDADAVIESYKPGTMSRLGLSYKTLEKINSRLVMTSISNFGQTGPYKDYKLTHLIAWGMSGGRFAHCDPPGNRPVLGGGWLTHYLAGIFGVNGTIAALFYRNATGTGQQVDVSILESIIAITEYPTVIYSFIAQGVVPRYSTQTKEVPYGYGRTPLGIVPCKDGYIGVNSLTLTQWQMICTYFGMPELAEDPRFITMRDTNEHLEEARAILGPRVLDREKMELFQSGAEWRIPFGLIPTTQDILESPQHEARGFLDHVEHPVIGKVTIPGAPFKLMESPWQHKAPAPLLGQHNEEVYGKLGFSKADLVKFHEQGVI